MSGRKSMDKGGSGSSKGSGGGKASSSSSSTSHGGATTAAAASPWRTVSRFVGEGEKQMLRSVKPFVSFPGSADLHSAGLTSNMNELVGQSDFGNMLQQHTMTPVGGGPIGGNQNMVSMTSSVSSLVHSTDTAVQNIVRNAPYIAHFEVPKTAALNAPSDLSRFEHEVVLPNDAPGLTAMMTHIQENPHRIAHAAPAPSLSTSATSVRKMSLTDSKSASSKK